MARPSWLPDNFMLMLLGSVALAATLPVHGAAAVAVKQVANVGVAILFFLHGAKLSRQAVVDGLLHWRLHLTVLASTFVLFPLLGLALRPWVAPLFGPELTLGVLFLCALPSTVQSSIAFTSIARGNVAAAMCSASVSNVLGVALTPLLVALMSQLGQGGAGGVAAGAGTAAISWHGVQGIVLQLLLPFVIGHLLQPRLGGWVARHRGVLKAFDQGTILLVVYAAFSEAMVQGLYGRLGWPVLAALLALCALLLAVVMGLLLWGSRRLGFAPADRVAILFCGSKKTLASGVPMAQVLFAGQPIGLLVLPIMLFHQLQLMVCAALAQRYARQAAELPPVMSMPTSRPSGAT